MFQAPKMSWFTLSVIFAFRLIFISGGVYAGSQEPFFPIQQHLEGPSSEYTDRLIRWAQKWPPRGLILEAQRGDSPVLLECLETLGKLDYIGIQQQMTIRAPLSRVEAILDDIDHYQDLFSGFETIRVESKNGNQILTYWEQKVPLFFIPNVKYKMTYLIDKSSLQRKFYRYQLRESSHIKASDGLIVIEEGIDSSQAPVTRYTEFDFFDANWGLLKIIASQKIWQESVDGVYQSDLAIKLKAENPTWSFNQVARESQKMMKAFPSSPCIENKKIFKDSKDE